MTCVAREEFGGEGATHAIQTGMLRPLHSQQSQRELAGIVFRQPNRPLAVEPEAPCAQPPAPRAASASTKT